MWQDISFGWRCWRQQRIRWAFLIIAWGMFSALAVIVTQLSISLSADRPSWSNSTESLYSVAYGMQGLLVTSKGVDLDYAKSTPGVRSYTKFAAMRQMLQLNGKRRKIDVLFYEPTFFELLDVDDAYDYVRDGGIFATSKLMRQLSEPNLVVTLGDSNITVRHVLPRQFEKFASKPVDLYIPMVQFTHFVPFKGKNATQTQAIINSLPYYHGLISVDDNFSVEPATQFMQQKIDQSGGSLVSINLETNIRLVSGVELLPKQRQELLRQLIVLALLFLAFAFVLISNYFSVVTAIAIERSQELSLKFALGATNSNQLISLLRENIPMLLGVVLVALGSALLIQAQLGDSHIYQEYFGNTFEFSWLQWSLVLTTCLLILIAISLLPMFNLLRRSHFSRGKGGFTKTQRRMFDLQFLSQILLTLCALNVSLSSGYQEWQKQRTDSLDMSISGIEITRSDGEAISLPVKWLLGQDNNIALSNEALIQSRAPLVEIRLLGDLQDKAHFTDKISITNNFLAMIGAKWAQHGKLAPGSIIVNRALAEKLIAGSNIHDLIGSQLVLGDAPKKQLTITGIVENVPHAGTSLSDMPMLYMSLQEKETIYSPLYIYSSKVISSGEILSKLDIPVQLGRVNQLGNIQQQLIDLNKNRRGLLFVTLQISLFIFVMLSVGLMYQLKTMLLGEQRMIGLSLAMGQQRQHLMASKLLKQILLCSVTAGAFVLIMWLSANYFQQKVSLDVYLPAPMVLSICLVLLSVVLMTILMLKKLMNTTIQRLLTGQV
ncbi:MAG: hypothetical protein HRU25_12855 [Psychrobium sp.]|nr:hypothetical protein [Psychrobium sp.]